MNALIEQLRATARMRGESFKAVGERAGYQPDTLSRWAQRGYNPRLIAFNDYAQALNYRLELVPDEPIDLPQFLPIR